MSCKLRYTLSVLMLAVVTGCSGPAEKVILEPLFSDNMVLQQKQAIPVWGKASPGGRVSVVLGNQELTVRAGKDSTWRVTFAPLDASSDPVAFRVVGKETLNVANVVVGEVWIASGQSNMEWILWNPMTKKGAVNGEEEVKNADYPLIRHIKIKKTALPAPTKRVTSDGWKVCNPENAGSFSAVGYFFARDLHQNLGVPVGIIGSNWGGTPIQPWISAQSIGELPGYAEKVAGLAESDVFKEAEPGPDNYTERMKEWRMKIKAKDPGYVDKWYESACNDGDWKNATVPGFWKDHYSDIRTLDGVAWYRTTFTVPAACAGKPAVLNMGAIDDHDITWLNGTEVGKGYVWNEPRVYKIPAGIIKAGKNVLAIRLKDELYAGGFWGEDDAYSLECAGRKIPLAGTWKTKLAFNFNEMPDKPKRAGRPQGQPTALYNGMIAPLVPYGMRGAIWYQGESNAGNGIEYRTLMPLLIRDWRAKWGIGDFPFYLVQLANYMKLQTEPVETRSWAELREAQLLTVQNVLNTGMAVIMDIGDADDIHPRNKQDVGKRLALVARNKTYGEKDLVYSGPVFKEALFDGNKVALLFDHVHDGLTTFDGKPLTGFAVCGPDTQFVWGHAAIRGNRVEVTSEKVDNITAVRYGWASNPVGNLANKNGLPASPFRTDPENN